MQDCQKRENECIVNYLTLALLMPLEEITTYIEETDFWNLSKRKKMRETKKLARRYGVTKVMAMKRILGIKGMMKHTKDEKFVEN